MPWVLEPTISVFERAKTVHALDRAATVVGGEEYYETINYIRGILYETVRYRIEQT
jgi:hypothetical protein